MWPDLMKAAEVELQPLLLLVLEPKTHPLRCVSSVVS